MFILLVKKLHKDLRKLRKVELEDDPNNVLDFEEKPIINKKNEA